MADQLQLRGGTTTEHATFTGALREVTVDTDKDTVVVHDNATAGGYPLLREDLSNLPAGTIVDADINASAAIAGTKVAPNFGSQTITTTGVINPALGTAALPSVAFTGDPNTGIYSPGADQVAISTNGTGQLTVSTTAVSSTLAVDHPLGAVGTPSITFTGDLNTGIFSPAADTLAASTGGSERARIDSSGRLLVGTSTYRSVGDSFAPSSVIFNEGSGTTTYQVFAGVHNRADTIGPQILLGKTRGTTNSSVTIVQDGDSLGEIAFAGADGVDLETRAASIKSEVDGTPGTNDMPGRLVFSTTADGASNPTERMRITNNGILLFAKTTNSEVDPGLRMTPSGFVGITRSGDAPVLLNRLASDGPIQGFQRSGTTVGSISVTTTNTAYNTSSDYRLKENVVPLSGAIDRLQQIPVHRFNFIADPDTVVDGFIAHEAQAIVPECVTGAKDEVDDDGNPVYQGIDQSKLVPLLTAALQEALAEIESLKARVTALEP
jgi:hypothetical protein